jgi:hypothetical protein
MKKSLFVILLACVSAPGWAQIQRTAVFDFSQPLSLTPSITPSLLGVPGSSFAYPK